MNTTNQKYRELKTVEDVRRAQGEGLAVEFASFGEWHTSGIDASATDGEIAICLIDVCYRAILPADAGDGLEVFEALVTKWRGMESEPGVLPAAKAAFADAAGHLTTAIAAYREARK